MASGTARTFYSDHDKRRLVEDVNRRYKKGSTLAAACEAVGIRDQSYYRWSEALGIPRPPARWLAKAADAAAEAAEAGEAVEAVAAIATVAAVTAIAESPSVEADRLALAEAEAEADDLRDLLAELFDRAPTPTIVVDAVLNCYLDAKSNTRAFRARLDLDVDPDLEDEPAEVEF